MLKHFLYYSTPESRNDLSKIEFTILQEHDKFKNQNFLVVLWSPVAHANDCANYPYKNGVQREHSDDGKSMLFSTYTFHHDKVESNIGIASIQDYGFSRAMEQLYDYINSENQKCHY